MNKCAKIDLCNAYILSDAREIHSSCHLTAWKFGRAIFWGVNHESGHDLHSYVCMNCTKSVHCDIPGCALVIKHDDGTLLKIRPIS